MTSVRHLGDVTNFDVTQYGARNQPHLEVVDLDELVLRQQPRRLDAEVLGDVQVLGADERAVGREGCHSRVSAW
jgi:hypothetical protein